MAEKNNRDWTHKGVRISDIRKLKNLYLIYLNEGNSIKVHYPHLIIGEPMTVNSRIFEERISSYFLKDADKITREEILSVKWNFFIQRGSFCKISDGDFIVHPMSKDKYYISFLEIDGPLATFDSILSKNQ